MTNHTSPPFTPEQEQRIAEIAARVAFAFEEQRIRTGAQRSIDEAEGRMEWVLYDVEDLLRD